jgi:hypothetical protein
VLKVSADKAGRKAKCKCGQDVVIPAATPPAALEDEGGTYGMAGDLSTAPKEQQPRQRKRGLDDDDDDEGGLVGTKNLEKVPEDSPFAGAKRRHRIPKARALLEPTRWKKVCVGLNLIAIGLWIWLASLLVRDLVILAGNFFADPEYASVRLRWENPDLYARMTNQTEGEVALNRTEFLIGTVTGGGWILTFGKWLFIVSTLLLLGAHGTLLAGYSCCLPVPDRYGSRGQVLALLALGSVNLLFALVFRLLPLLGAMDYVLIPVVLPEMALMEVNFERQLPLSVTLSFLPVLDYLLSFIVLACYFLELVVLAVFIRAIALAMKSEVLQPIADKMVRLALGTAFLQLVNTMLMITGSSELLIVFMRIMYLLGMGFFIGELIWFARVALQTPPLVEQELETAEEAAAAVRGRKGRKRADEDEDEEEEDEDED